MKWLFNFTNRLSPIQKIIAYCMLGVVLIALGYWLTSRFNPAPPKTITFRAGSAGGAYDAYAKQYAKELAKQGITVKIIPSAGSVENLSRLFDNTADVALAQSGLATEAQLTQLQGIASVAYEPVWIFTRANAPKVSTLAELVKLNIAAPKTGSGARATLDHLFKESTVKPNINWQEYAPTDAVIALNEGRVDGLVLVASIQAPVVQQLLNSPHYLNSFEHAPGIARKSPAYSVVTLPRGSINQAEDKPARDIQLLASQALLVSHNELHPALVYLLLDAAQKIHMGSSAVHNAGTFPSVKTAELTTADETVRYFKDGKPWLEKVLPFWLANFIARLLLVLIPLAAVIFPIAKLWPEAEAFMAKRALQPRYEAIHELEKRFFSVAGQDKAPFLTQLSALESDASVTKVPSDHIKDRYALMQNIGVVRERINKA